MTFKALLGEKPGETISTRVVEQPGDVTVAVDYSTVNCKDALALDEVPAVVNRMFEGKLQGVSSTSMPDWNCNRFTDVSRLTPGRYNQAGEKRP